MPPGADASGLLAIMASGASKYTDADRKNARLPLPPDQDSEVQELLRPGLLADVEITVQKLPDAIHVPAQAIFQKDGENVVFVQQPDGKFQARKVELGRRSESAMVLTAGVEPGEVVALSDPTAGKSPSKSDKKEPAKGGPISSMPGGK
jgi:multidrug efflux pump subunit AcrA (membrane-fusion protein)